MASSFRSAAAGSELAAAASLLPGPLQARLSALYALSQDSPYVFASPLGPFHFRGQPAYLPRLVFFGPQASDDSWRLSFLAGFDHRDLRASRALLALVASLAENVEAGHGLNLSFFPLVDAGGLIFDASDRALGAAHWGRGAPPEIRLLERDARGGGYHGFVRIETASSAEDLVSIRIRQPATQPLSPDLDLITSDDAESFPVRFETIPSGIPAADGPLSVTDDLPIAPFELTIQVPAAWPDHDYQRAVVVLLKRFLRRYRAFQAYGQHL
jgi:hypothetical protein